MSNKQPVSKAKKEFISWIIWLITGVIFIAGGAVMISIDKGNTIAWIVGGSIMSACGLAIAILSILKLVKSNKQLKQEKAH